MDAKGEFKATNLDQRVQETISNLSDAELLKMLEASPRDYTPYALEVALDELSRRGGKEAAIRRTGPSTHSETAADAPGGTQRVIRAIHQTVVNLYSVLFRRGKAVWAWFFISLSIIGLFASLIVHLAGPLQIQNPLEGITRWLQAGVGVVLVAALFFQIKSSGSTTRTNRAGLLRLCPAWMRYTFYVTLFYVSARFTVLFLKSNVHSVGDLIRVLVQAFTNPIEVEIPDEDIHLSSLIWMAFYAAALVTIFASLHADSPGNRRQCLNGHPAQKSEKHCNECGAPVERGPNSRREGKRKPVSK